MVVKDSRTFQEDMLQSCMTRQSARFGFFDANDAINFYRNVLMGIHQKSLRRTIEVAWPLLDTTNNETKGASKERVLGHFGARRILPHSMRSREILVF